MHYLQCMASPTGLEPVTHSLGNCCSILLSYGDVFQINALESHSLCAAELDADPTPELELGAPSIARRRVRREPSRWSRSLEGCPILVVELDREGIVV